MECKKCNGAIPDGAPNERTAERRFFVDLQVFFGF